jgi:CRP/FNR family transcriptional regulator
MRESPFPEANGGSKQADDHFYFSNTGQWAALEPHGPLHLIKPGTRLFGQGEAARQVFLINRGLVKLTHLAENGKELILCLRSSNWILGAAPLIADKPHSVTAVTLSACEIRSLGSGAFLSLVRGDSDFAWNLLQMFSREVYDRRISAFILKTLSAKARLERVFRQLIETSDELLSKKNISITLPLKHKELAALIAVSPEHLSRLLKQMEREGILRVERGKVVVADLDKLWSDQ